jgi:hypothetical protein
LPFVQVGERRQDEAYNGADRRNKCRKRFPFSMLIMSRSVFGLIHVCLAERQGDCYKCIQFALCACAGLSFFVERFSDCLGALCLEDSGSSAPDAGAAPSVLAESPPGSVSAAECRGIVSPPSTAALPAVLNASANDATGPETSSASSLPPAVLARIEANRQAAMQRRRAAEDAANLQRECESATRASAGTPQHASGHLPAIDALTPCAVPPRANRVMLSAKRHWGAVGAVSDDGGD